MTDDDPLNLRGLLAQLVGKEPSDEERREALDRKLEMASGLWHGDDADAQVARKLLDACGTLLQTAMDHGPISQMVHRSMMKVVNEAMETIDALIKIGVVRATAQGKPTPAEPEWLMREKPDKET